MSKLKIAMMRAKEARGVASAEAREEYGPTPEPPRPDPAPEPAPDQAGPRPAQTRTRVEAADHDTLVRNKILSFFHGSAVADRVKILRTQILNKMAEVDGNSLLIASARPREGKTFTAVNLAVSLSHEVDRTTLLVDADLRKPSVHEYFGISGSAGLTDYLLGQARVEDLLVNPGIPKLTLLPAGPRVPNSAELLGSPRMEALVREMKERYADRFLIFDTSSLLTSAEPLVFSRLIDGILLVVEAERTSKRDVARAIEMLAERPLMGILYNKFKTD